jgi:hypothetical protein
MFVMAREIEGTCGEIKVSNPHGEERGTRVSNHEGPRCSSSACILRDAREEARSSG